MDASVRAVWRALDRPTRRELDDAVTAGRAVPRSEFATVGVWRALRRRREWLAALVVTLWSAGATWLLHPRAAVVVGVAALLPLERLWRLHRAIDANVALAAAGPQRTAISTRRPRSELERRLTERG